MDPFGNIFVSGYMSALIMAQLTMKSVNEYFVEERKRTASQANVISGHIGISDYLYDDSKAIVFDYDINQTSKQSGYRIIVIDKTGTVINDSNKTEEGKVYFLPEVIDALNNKDVAKVYGNDTIHAAVSIVRRSLKLRRRCASQRFHSRYSVKCRSYRK